MHELHPRVMIHALHPVDTPCRGEPSCFPLLFLFNNWGVVSNDSRVNPPISKGQSLFTYGSVRVNI